MTSEAVPEYTGGPSSSLERVGHSPRAAHLFRTAGMASVPCTVSPRHRLRPQVTAFAAALVAMAVALPPPAHPLGFSADADLLSRLGEPLDVRLVASGLEEDFANARLRIASAQTYAALGLQRPAVLDAARVELLARRDAVGDAAGTGSATLRVTSPLRVQEPVLNLVLEAIDVHGVVRREYTLLLDPPEAPVAMPVTRPVAAVPGRRAGPAGLSSSLGGEVRSAGSARTNAAGGEAFASSSALLAEAAAGAGGGRGGEVTVVRPGAAIPAPSAGESSARVMSIANAPASGSARSGRGAAKVGAKPAAAIVPAGALVTASADGDRGNAPRTARAGLDRDAVAPLPRGRPLRLKLLTRLTQPTPRFAAAPTQPATLVLVPRLGAQSLAALASRKAGAPANAVLVPNEVAATSGSGIAGTTEGDAPAAGRERWLLALLAAAFVVILLQGLALWRRRRAGTALRGDGDERYAAADGDAEGGVRGTRRAGSTTGRGGAVAATSAAGKPAGAGSNATSAVASSVATAAPTSTTTASPATVGGPSPARVVEWRSMTTGERSGAPGAATGATPAGGAEDVLDPSGENFFDTEREVVRLLGDTLRYAPQRQDLRYQLLQLHHAEGEAAAFVEHARRYAEELAWPEPGGVAAGVDGGTGGSDGTARGEHWAHIAAMGRALLPLEPLFGGADAASGAEPGAVASGERTLGTRAGARPPVPGLPTAARPRRHYDGLDAAALASALRNLREGYLALAGSSAFKRALSGLALRELERPTGLTLARALTAHVGGAQIVLKREDLRAPRESQRINAAGQALLAQQLGRRRLVAATHNGLHGEAAARAAFARGLPLTLYLPQALLDETAHPSLRLVRMLEAELVPVPEGADVRRAALAHWLAAPEERYYLAGLDAGPPPYPAIVDDLQTVIGDETLEQVRALAPEGVHAAVCARASGAAGFGFLRPLMAARADTEVHYVLTPGPTIGGEHTHHFEREQAWLRGTGRVQLVPPTMAEVYGAAQLGARLEGLPQDAVNAATLAQLLKVAGTLPRGRVVAGLFVNTSETGAPAPAALPDPDGFRVDDPVAAALAETLP